MHKARGKHVGFSNFLNHKFSLDQDDKYLLFYCHDSSPLCGTTKHNSPGMILNLNSGIQQQYNRNNPHLISVDSKPASWGFRAFLHNTEISRDFPRIKFRDKNVTLLRNVFYIV